MKKQSLLFAATITILLSCNKQIETPAGQDMDSSKTDAVVQRAKRKGPTAVAYKTYTIQQGSHNCDQSTIASVRTSEMKFKVRFNESAIYTTVLPGNQADINKLWGFSEGFNNQYNSARFGWTWYNNALRLHAYVYNKGVRGYKEITSIGIGEEVDCSIKISGSSYIFTAKGISVSMGRGGSGTSASGYQQFPYFGGDETAPQLITIDIATQ